MKTKVLNDIFDAWFEVPVVNVGPPFKLRAFKKEAKHKRSTK